MKMKDLAVIFTLISQAHPIPPVGFCAIEGIIRPLEPFLEAGPCVIFGNPEAEGDVAHTPEGCHRDH